MCLSLTHPCSDFMQLTMGELPKNYNTIYRPIYIIGYEYMTRYYELVIIVIN